MLAKKTIEFILFGSIFIACCAVGLCIETNLLLHVSLNGISFYCFVFGATLAQYNLHYLVKVKAVNHSRRLAWSLINRRVHVCLVITGSILIVVSLFSFHLHHFIFLLFLGVIAFIYSFPVLPFTQKKRLKDFGFIKITTLAFLWTLVTVWFPVDQLNFNSTSFQLIFLRRFIFMFILCLLFDIRDVEVDGSESIHTLPVLMGIRTCYILCYLLLTLFVVLTFIQFFYLPETGALYAMLASACSIFLTIRYTRKNNSDFVYLLCVDGMMLLQAILVILTSI